MSSIKPDHSNQLIDPYRGTVIAGYPLESFASADTKISNAKAAQQSWQQLPFTKRRELYLGALTYIEQNLDTYAVRISTEMFKLVRQAKEELECGIAKLKRIAELAETALQDRFVAADGAAFEFTLQRVAKGVIYTIAPW
jgi:acyl-CoA reductase-like NAD-dependent aldehyde dehydrogenase